MSSKYKRIRDYELMVVLHPELSEEDLVAEIGRTEGHITTQSGTIRLVNREAPWGRRRLSYPIRHSSRDVRDGFYVLIYFTSESAALGEIEREIKLNDKIIRYLLTQQTAPIMEPTPVEDEGATAATDESAAPEASATVAEPATEVALETTLEAVTEASSDVDTEVAIETETVAPAVDDDVADSAVVEETTEDVAAEPEDESTTS